MLDEETKTQINRVLTWILFAALIVSVIAVIYVALNPVETADPFTEFYILGPNGEAADYPTQLDPDETGTVIVGISNHEHEDLTYRVTVAWNNTTTGERVIRVQDDETEEFQLTLTAPPDPGRYEVRFRLFRADSDIGEPYRWLRLWVTVNEPS